MYPVTNKFIADFELASIMDIVADPFLTTLVDTGKVINFTRLEPTTDAIGFTTIAYEIDYVDEATFLDLINNSIEAANVLETILNYDIQFIVEINGEVFHKPL